MKELEGQLALWELPVKPKITHTWAWAPFYSECTECGEIWFATADRDDVKQFLTERCPAVH